MKQILLTMAALFGCMAMGMAQSNLIATLKHHGEYKQYYGSGALSSAYNASVDGDTITLSPGTFTFRTSWNNQDFHTGVTLRGAGIDANSQTFISDYIYFHSTDSARTLTIEGVCFSNNVRICNNSNGNGQGRIRFLKNRFNGGINFYGNTPDANGPEVRFFNNIINAVTFESNSYPQRVQFYNCYVGSVSNNAGEVRTTFMNCHVYLGYPSNLSFYNCILAGSPNSNYTIANAYNCLGIGNGALSYVRNAGNNYTVNSYADVYTTFTGGWKKGETFELTENARTTYLGADGTEVGMRGGYYPYSSKVQYPVLTTFESDVQTNKDGMLNIRVEADGQ